MAKSFSRPRVLPKRGGLRLSDQQRKAATIWYNHYSGGGGAQKYEPTDFPNLVFDLNPEMDLAELADQESIVSYTESVSGITVTPSGISRRPRKKANGINGFATIDVFQNCDMIGSKSDFNFLHEGSSTTFIIFKSTLDAAQQFIFATSRISASVRGCWFVIQSTDQYSNAVTNGSAAVVGASTLQGVHVKDVWHLLVIRYDMSAVDNTAGMGWLDNFNYVSNTILATPSAGDSGDNPTFFKTSNPGSSSGFFRGELARMFSYSYAMPVADIIRLSGGLSTKYFA